MNTVILHLTIILSTILLAFLLALLFSGMYLHMYKTKIKVKGIDDIALERAYHRFAVWYKSSILWTIAEYVFVIVPFVSNVIVVYITNTSADTIDGEVILLHSIISLSFIIFGYAINPQRHKKCYRKAFRCLDSSISQYLSTLNSGKSSSYILDKGTKDGEDFIDETYDV